MSTLLILGKNDKMEPIIGEALKTTKLLPGCWEQFTYSRWKCPQDASTTGTSISWRHPIALLGQQSLYWVQCQSTSSRFDNDCFQCISQEIILKNIILQTLPTLAHQYNALHHYTLVGGDCVHVYLFAYPVRHRLLCIQNGGS